MHNNIITFMQMNGESFYKARERFKELLRRRKYHRPPIWIQKHTFYNGAHHIIQASLNVAIGGTLQNKSPEETFDLLEEMASNSYQWPTERYQA